MNKILVGTCFLLFISAGVLGQSSFSPGMIITNENDTVYGFINNQGEKLNADQCKFRATLDSPTETFLPGNLFAYKTGDGRYYVSREVVINETNYQFFLEYLVDGVYDLLFANSLGKDRYFIENNEGIILELSNEEELVIVGGKNYVQNTERHKKIMSSYFADAPDVAPMIATAELNHKSLINITKTYHEITCKDEECIVYIQTGIPIKIRIGPSVGAYYASLNSIQSDKKFTAVLGNNYFAGIAIRFEFPRRTNRATFDIYADYARLFLYDITGSGETYYSTENIYADQLKIKMGPSYAIQPLVKCKLKISVSAGIQGNYYMNYRGISRVDRISGNRVLLETSEPEGMGLNTFQIGAYAGIGAEYPVGKRIVFLKVTSDYIIIAVDNENVYKFLGFGFSTGFLF